MEKDTDTVADVVRAGKNATPGLKSMQTALEAAQTIAERLQDHELAARILEHSKSKDLQGLTKLLQKETRGVKLEVEFGQRLHDHPTSLRRRSCLQSLYWARLSPAKRSKESHCVLGGTPRVSAGTLIGEEGSRNTRGLSSECRQGDDDGKALSKQGSLMATRLSAAGARRQSWEGSHRQREGCHRAQVLAVRRWAIPSRRSRPQSRKRGWAFGLGLGVRIKQRHEHQWLSSSEVQGAACRNHGKHQYYQTNQTNGRGQ